MQNEVFSQIANCRPLVHHSSEFLQSLRQCLVPELPRIRRVVEFLNRIQVGSAENAVSGDCHEFAVEIDHLMRETLPIERGKVRPGVVPWVVRLAGSVAAFSDA